MGGKIKFAESLSGRYADVLSNLYLGYATLWFHGKNPSQGGDAVAAWALDNILVDIQVGGKHLSPPSVPPYCPPTLPPSRLSSVVVWLLSSPPLPSLPLSLQDAFYGISENFPIRPVGWAIQALTFPTGKTYVRPSDKLTTEVAQLISKPSGTCHRKGGREGECGSARGKS